MVYVGGAVVSLYADDPAANDVRPTKDVDISLEIASLGELEKLREQITAKGFVQKAASDVICRFWFNDVMATKAIGWAPANEWFAPGFRHLEIRDVDGTNVRVLSYPYFLASKFVAYNDRGKKDARTSKDFEDIVYLLDNRIKLAEEVLSSPNDVKGYLTAEFIKINVDRKLLEAVQAHLYYETQVERYELIMQKLKAVIDKA